ncbi:polysaccharide biosynthesis tyrosine autokinase [Thalassomonas sp. M1454]|uniref:polysaccharide biosynthesis tyrosine autokinase n=1 Tax=Thalassomonas sp. M1454 TaxID=2594477 RepID=UPI00117DF46F|nr:polysaccharide biosynthesis tyrosine autokinase [Thalassomonas sp. M1454]TRX57200.1 polysaccharide biosynthesis tyrosine autokinase [Thalassomonas sp. M1454]
MTETKNTQKIKVDNNNSSDEIDLARLFGLLLDSKWLIIFVTAAFTFIGIVYALMATPVYKADALIQIEEKTSGLPGVADLEEMLGGEHDPETEMALLKSRRVLSYAVDELNLEIVTSPKYKGSLGKFFARRYGSNVEGQVFNQPMAANLFDDSYAWGGEQIKVTTFNVTSSYLDETFELTNLGNGAYTLTLGEEQILTGKVNELATTKSGSIELLVTDLKSDVGTGFYVKRLYREDIIGALQKTLSVAGQGKDTGILTATYEGTKKQHVEDVLHAITQGFLLQNVQRMSAEIQNSIDYIKSELPVYKDELEQAEAKLNDYRLENKSVDLSIETQSFLDQVVELDTRIHELSFKEAEISQRFTKEHPSYISLNKKKQELLEQKEELTQSVQGLPETQQQVLRLARDVEVNQQIYLYMLNKNQELRVAKAGTVGNIHIVDEAVVGRKPVKPKKALIVVLATLLGGMFSVAFVLIKAAFHRGVTNPQDFEDIGLTVYATIPVSDAQSKFLDKKKLKEKISSKVGRKKSKIQEILVAKENPTDLAVEAVRSLRTSLHFAMLEAKNNVVMISGASPGVGKSFISSNLATVLAQAGQKVLLIDADMRKGYMQKLFNLSWGNGLSELLSGKAQLQDVVKATDIENLSLITRGEVPPNPSELLMGQYYTKLIEQASKQYDLVIIDTPPILAVTDASIIGHHAGTSLMLARFNQSSLKEVAAAVNRFELNGIDVKGIIFNAVEKKASSYYGDYGYYNYEYKSK